MGKILYTKNDVKGALNYLAAKVTDIRENKDDKHPFVVTVEANVYVRDEENPKGHFERKSIQLQSWPDSKWGQYERVKKMNLRVGSFVCCTVGKLTEYTPKSGKPVLQGLLFNISYSNAYTIHDEDKEYFFLCGTVKSVHEFKKDGSAEVEVNYPKYDSTTATRENVTYTVLLDDKTYAALKKNKLEKGGSLAVIGTLEDMVVTAKRAEFGERVKKDEKKS